MEVYKGSGVTFYIIDNQVYFKTALQTMELSYPQNKFPTHMRDIAIKIRAGEIADVKTLYLHLNDKISCRLAWIKL